MITFISYPKCSICRKAKEFLDKRGIAYVTRDIKIEHPKKDELKKWMELGKLPLHRFYNTGGLLFRALSINERILSTDQDLKICVLAANGMLVKRPILVGDDFVLVGFNLREWTAKFGEKIIEETV